MKFCFILWLSALTLTANATRTIDADVIKSSDRTKTWTMPAATGTVSTLAGSETLTNKTINADSNTITNIENADVKASAAIDAAKIADGSVSSTEFQYISTVTSNVQTQLDAKQTLDATLTALAGASTAANKAPYFDGVDSVAVMDVTAFARTFFDDADASAVRTTLGLVIGTNVQAYDAELAAIAGLTSAADKIVSFSGAGTAAALGLGAGLSISGGNLVNTATGGYIQAVDTGNYRTAGYRDEAGNCTVTEVGGDSIATLTQNANGDCSAAFQAGAYTTAPICVCTAAKNSSTAERYCFLNALATTSGFQIYITDGSALTADLHNVFCFGGR